MVIMVLGTVMIMREIVEWYENLRKMKIISMISISGNLKTKSRSS